MSEIPTITEEEYAEHAAEQEAEMQDFVRQQMNQKVRGLNFVAGETSNAEALRETAEIAYWRSQLCTDEGGDNI